jgi:predicted DNA-binding transcriptional regulator YafY
MRADRLVSLILMLQTRGRQTAESLAAELEVSRRTILRDVDALSIAGIPIMAEGGHGGGVWLDEAYRTSLTGLLEHEASALAIQNNTDLLAEIGLGEAAERGLLKIKAAFPDRYLSTVKHIQQRIYIDPLWWWHDSPAPDIWTDLQTAVYTDRCVTVIYENYDGASIERQLEPYSLVSKSNYWYLVAKRQGEMRTYRVSRIRALSLLDESFERDTHFDLVPYWESRLAEFAASFSEYQCVLRVHPDRINWLKTLTAGRYTILGEGEDDDAWLRLQFHIDSEVMATMLVFGAGNQVEILEPESLRQTVIAQAEAVLHHTRTTPSR